MITYKEFISEGRWLAGTKLYDRLYVTIKDVVLRSFPIDDFVSVSRQKEISADNAFVNRAFMQMKLDLQDSVKPLIVGTFLKKFPTVPDDVYDFQVLISKNAASTLGAISGDMEKLSIHIYLNPYETFNNMIISVAKKKEGALSTRDFKKFLIKEVIEGWSSTIYHECVHVAQAIALRQTNFDLYKRRFMKKRYLDPRFRKAYLSNTRGAYLNQTQEIQAHAASTAIKMRKRISDAKAKGVVNHWYSWLTTADKAKPDTWDRVFGGSFYVMRVVQNAPADILKLLEEYPDFTVYTEAFLMNETGERSINRFVREVLRTFDDMR